MFSAHPSSDSRRRAPLKPTMLTVSTSEDTWMLDSKARRRSASWGGYVPYALSATAAPALEEQSDRRTASPQRSRPQAAPEDNVHDPCALGVWQLPSTTGIAWQDELHPAGPLEVQSGLQEVQPVLPEEEGTRDSGANSSGHGLDAAETEDILIIRPDTSSEDDFPVESYHCSGNVFESDGRATDVDEGWCLSSLSLWQAFALRTKTGEGKPAHPDGGRYPMMLGRRESPCGACQAVTGPSTKATLCDSLNRDDRFSTRNEACLAASNSKVKQVKIARRASKDPAPSMKHTHQTSDATTLMIKNVPKQLDQLVLMDELNVNGFAGSYDFLYMPHDFATCQNMGFAFINFKTVLAASTFSKRGCQAQSFTIWPKNITPAAVQGLQANLDRWNTPRLRRIRNPRHRPYVEGSIINPPA